MNSSTATPTAQAGIIIKIFRTGNFFATFSAGPKDGACSCLTQVKAPTKFDYRTLERWQSG